MKTSRVPFAELVSVELVEKSQRRSTFVVLGIVAALTLMMAYAISTFTWSFSV